MKKTGIANRLICSLLLATGISQIPIATASAGVIKPHKDKPDTVNNWRQLFNGKDLTGWKHVGKGSISVENGLIRGHGGLGLLYWTKEKFSNCIIHVVYRMQKANSNAGVFIRIPIEPHEE